MIRVAFCSDDKQHIDAHFARSSTVVIYEFGDSSYRAVNVVSFEPKDFHEKHAKGKVHHNTSQLSEKEDRVGQRIDAVKDCSILYCSHIGGPAAARLIQQNIYPIKAEVGTRIDEAALRLHHLLVKSPPHWLQKKVKTLG